jgi:hypothetical protein
MLGGEGIGKYKNISGLPKVCLLGKLFHPNSKT